ncbi:hypothetical protein HAX54_003032 [Datura stramonium]|uniref:Uncharacterized protein n=1 Tax=Datura stramonium TaxID=4076 RepID=A0ABS8T620_DATST|nr:hypothetical protein [Datura stramonium]
MRRSTNIFDPPRDRAIVAPNETMDITNIQGPNETPKFKLTKCRRSGMDFTKLDAQFSLLSISKSILGEGMELPENEDVDMKDFMAQHSRLMNKVTLMDLMRNRP